MSTAILCASTASYAGVEGTSKLNTTVQNIYISVTGKAFVTFDAGTMPHCWGDSGARLDIKDSDQSKAVYSTLLSAQMSGKKLHVGYDYTAANSGWDLCSITFVSMATEQH